ncbi:hypothetical protein [Nonomuraea sp. LPB2021202275-12-8]|uniref:hypothetical protein n=1 Tax=Nonomuraea sp. LPB2021202275-12-8 TaxID=3120159 RepID=UPI00300C4D15
MGFWKTIYGLARKRFVGPPIAVAAIVLALAGFFLVPSRYVSTASMVLTVPASGGTLETEPQQKPGLTNPLLQFNDALRTTAGILILATNTPEVAAEVGVTEGGPTQLTINDGRTNPDLLGISTNGPFVYVEVESTSPQLVRETMRRAQQRVRLELARRQVALSAPISTHIGILDVMPASSPRPLVQDRLVAAAGGGLLAVVAGLTVAYAVPRLRASRRTPGEAADSPPPDSGPPDDRPPGAAPDARPGQESNGAHAPAAAVFPLTVAELEAAQEGRNGSVAPRAVDDTGPIEIVVPGDDQLDSTT